MDEAALSARDLAIDRVGEATIPSPLDTAFADGAQDRLAVPERASLESAMESGAPLPFFECAGPRRLLAFDPAETRVAIVTCGGLCPGLNDVIRGLTLIAKSVYGVRDVLGIRYGYRGLAEGLSIDPMPLDAELVSEIHRRGGTILDSSRGRQDVGTMVDRLVQMDVDVLFTIGGEGTQQGALEISREIERRGLRIAVVGVPKTIDNDIPFIRKSFGFETAVAEAVRAITGGHIEAHDFPNGVAIIRLMGRESGFIAASASIASGDVNCCLVPEVPFSLDGRNGVVSVVERRLRSRGHAVIVVAEGAGRDQRVAAGYDDVGPYLRDRIRESLAERGFDVSLKYIDPSYLIRSVPAVADDSVFCARLAADAVHAAMAGRTAMVVGFRSDAFVHVPMRILHGRRTMDPDGALWRSVLEATGQPKDMVCRDGSEGGGGPSFEDS